MIWATISPPPSLLSFQPALGRGPTSHLGRGPLSLLAGAPSHLDLITPTLASPPAQGPLEGMGYEVVWGWEVASYPIILAIPLDSLLRGSHVPISKILYTELGGWRPHSWLPG